MVPPILRSPWVRCFSRVRLSNCCYKPTVGGWGWTRRSTEEEVPVERTPADEALLGLARMFMDASVRSADELGGLSPVQLRALTVLLQFSGANLAQLAEEMG